MRTDRFMMDYLSELQQCLEAVPADRIAAIAEQLLAAYRQNRLVVVVGNGGSAATASHIACDLGKTILGASPSPAAQRFRVLALTDNVPLITAWANDIRYELVFSEQIRCWVGSGDIVIVISGSGNSPNICAAVEAARELGAHTIGFLGFDGGKAKDLVDTAIVVPSDNYGHIEDVHAVFGHMITAYIKDVVKAEQDSASLRPANGHNHAESAYLDSQGSPVLVSANLESTQARAAD